MHIDIEFVYTLLTVINKENCPLKDCRIVSDIFDYDGGVLLIEEHAVKVTVPIGAIDRFCIVQIEAAASLFGPFIIPEDYYPISAYVWVGACYEFKKQLKVEIEHNIAVSEEITSELCILTACEKDICEKKDGKKLLKMHKDTSEYQYIISDSTLTFFTYHFCSKCSAIKGNVKIAKRVMMYHYLPEDYKSDKEFVAEVCFCYDLTFCKKVVTYVVVAKQIAIAAYLQNFHQSNQIINYVYMITHVHEYIREQYYECTAVAFDYTHDSMTLVSIWHVSYHTINAQN